MATLYRQFPLLQKGPANKIRVLELLLDRPSAARPDPTIRFKLHFSNVGDSTEKPYIALSYVWGSEEKSPVHTVLIHGHRIAVRENLWDFLHQERARRLSLSTEQNTADFQNLWIDAICIDQSSIAERNHQVSFMGGIYSKASKVLVWLGTRDLSFERLRQADQKARVIELRTAKISERRREFKPVGALIRKEIKTLFSNEYWSRMWIVQEYLLARKLDLMASTDVLESHVLARLCDIISYKSQLSPVVRNIMSSHQVKEPVFAPKMHIAKGYGEPLFRRPPVSSGYVRVRRGGRVYHHTFPYEFSKKTPVIPVSWVLWGGDTRGLVQEEWFEILPRGYVPRQLRPLKDLLLAFGSQECKEQIDRVYGLLSLVTKEDCEYFNLTPDYSKSPAVLFVELAYRFHLREGSEVGTVTSRRLANILGLQRTLDVEFTLRQIRKDIDMHHVTLAKVLTNKAQERIEAIAS